MTSASVDIPSRIEVRDFIVAHFNNEEMTLLCADHFGDVYSNYAGTNITLQKWGLELIEYCERNGIVENLHSALRAKRPAPWADKFGLPTRSVVNGPVRNPQQVFISHAKEDAELAQRLAADLRKWDVPVWIAPNSIKAGEQWVDALGNGLLESGVFLLLMTPYAVASKWVQKETRTAIQYEHRDVMRLFPLDVKECEWDQLSPLLSGFQAINFRGNYDNGLRELGKAIGVRRLILEAELAEARQQIAQLQTELKTARKQQKASANADAEGRCAG